MKFKVVEYRKKVDNGWRLATINDVRSSMQDVKKELHGKDWHICALQDGNVGGPGYDYEIKREVKELGHKLIVKIGMEFKVVEYHKKLDNGWRLATINDVRSSMEDVKEELNGKEWHICALQDGNIGGSGYDYEIKNEVKELGHKFIVKGNPYPNQNFAYPPNPPVNSGYKQPYNPGAYPPQQNVYPSAAQPPITGYPPSHPSAVGPPPPYYPADPNLQNAYPPMQSSYPPVQNPPAYAPASYPQTTIASGAYDPCARFGSGATPNIPPPPPGVMPNSAQMASMQGRPVMMQQQNSSNMISGPPGGGSTFW